MEETVVNTGESSGNYSSKIKSFIFKFRDLILITFIILISFLSAGVYFAGEQEKAEREALVELAMQQDNNAASAVDPFSTEETFLFETQSATGFCYDDNGNLFYCGPGGLDPDTKDSNAELEKKKQDGTLGNYEQLEDQKREANAIAQQRKSDAVATPEEREDFRANAPPGTAINIGGGVVVVKCREDEACTTQSVLKYQEKNNGKLPDNYDEVAEWNNMDQIVQKRLNDPAWYGVPTIPPAMPPAGGQQPVPDSNVPPPQANTICPPGATRGADGKCVEPEPNNPPGTRYNNSQANTICPPGATRGANGECVEPPTPTRIVAIPTIRVLTPTPLPQLVKPIADVCPPGTRIIGTNQGSMCEPVKEGDNASPSFGEKTWEAIKDITGGAIGGLGDAVDYLGNTNIEYKGNTGENIGRSIGDNAKDILDAILPFYTDEISPIIPSSGDEAVETTIAIGTYTSGIGENSSLGQNPNPVRGQKFEILLFDLDDNLIKFSGEASVQARTTNYLPTRIGYGGVWGLGNDLPDGSYKLKVRRENTLWKSINVNIESGQNLVPPIELIAGDIDQDNQISLYDYNILIACLTNENCANREQADLNLDGQVDALDLNILLSGFATRKGE